MATTTNLGKVHVFPSEESYNANKGSVGASDLALVPIGAASISEYGLVRLASEADVLSEGEGAVVHVPLAYELNDFRRMNTAYQVGDKVNCAFRFEFYLECTQAGTTGAETLDTRSVTFGQEITDGTVKWIVRAHVKSVGGSIPDANGNISIDLDDYATEADILAAADQALNGNLQNTGQIDLADVMSTLAELESNFNGLPNPAAYITETWQAEDKQSWYRKWSDGWIEQGGIGTGGGYVSTARCNFPIEFADTNYTLVAVPVTADQGNVSRSMFFASFDTTGAIANTSFNGANGAALRYCWYACGQYKQE